MGRLTGIFAMEGLPIGVFEGEPDALGRPGYVIHREDCERIIGRVHRDDRHVYRTNYKGRRIGYDRRHSCWRAEPQSMVPPFERGFWRRCFPTRTRAILELVRWSAGPTP